MAYLYCHTCLLEQDDFWDEDYNPITFLETNFKKELLTMPLDEILENESNKEKITRREYLAQQLEQAAQDIRKMRYRTADEFNNKPDAMCIRCRARNGDIG